MVNEMTIHGRLLIPCFTSIEEMTAYYKSLSDFRTNEFLNSYNDHIARMEIVASSAKLYIMKNYVKVVDWSKLEINLKTARGKKYSFYKHVPYGNYTDNDFGRMFKCIDEESLANECPVTSITDFSLDPTDGDFSVTVNEIEFYRLSDEEVIILAHYIEEQLKYTDLPF